MGKHERRFTGFDDKVIALHVRGLTVREIQAFLKEAYAVEVSPDLIWLALRNITGKWHRGAPTEELEPRIANLNPAPRT